MDDQGRRLDFHALRKTFNTNLEIAGASDKERMKLARLKSPRLMMKLWRQRKSASGGCVSENAGVRWLESGNHYTEKHTEILVRSGQTVSKPLTIKSDLNADKTPVNKGACQNFTPLGIPCLKESNAQSWFSHAPTGSLVALTGLLPQPGAGSSSCQREQDRDDRESGRTDDCRCAGSRHPFWPQTSRDEENSSGCFQRRF